MSELMIVSDVLVAGYHYAITVVRTCLTWKTII